MFHALRGITLVLAGVLMTSLAFAGFEKPTNFGARSAAMGGVAVGHNNTISAVFYNPAHLKYVEKWTVGVDVLPSITTTTTGLVPLAGGTQNAKLFFLPIFNVGTAFRVNDTVVMGIGVNSPAGLATRYENYGGTAGLTLNVDFKLIEAAPFVVFEFAPGVALALQYRASYAIYNQEITGTLNHKNLTATNFLGGRLGFSHEVNPNWHWGFAVRSETVSTLKGTTTIPAAGITNGNISLLNVRYPWEFSAGMAYVTTNHVLTVALDAGYRLYSRVTALDFDVALIPTNETTFDSTLNYHDSFFAKLGTEIRVSREWMVRFGGGITTQTTNQAFDSPLLSIPGLGINAGTGVGYVADNWGVDVSYDINFGSGTGNFSPAFGSLTNVKRSGVAHALGVSFNFFGS